jgi:hypothetical protein
LWIAQHPRRRGAALEIIAGPYETVEAFEHAVFRMRLRDVAAIWSSPGGQI